MHCWGKLKSLRAQSVGEVSAYTSHACSFQDMWKWSQPGLQKLAMPLKGMQRESGRGGEGEGGIGRGGRSWLVCCFLKLAWKQHNIG